MNTTNPLRFSPAQLQLLPYVCKRDKDAAIQLKVSSSAIRRRLELMFAKAQVSGKLELYQKLSLVPDYAEQMAIISPSDVRGTGRTTTVVSQSGSKRTK